MKKHVPKLIVLFTLVIILVVISIFLWGAFTYESICTTCGAEESATDWQIPFTTITCWHSSSVHPTPLSTYLNSHSLTPPHTHTFLFATGAGNGVMCALGKGHYITRAATSKQLPDFLDLVRRTDGGVGADVWTKRLLDPNESDKATMLIQLFNPSPATTLQQYQQWKNENSESIPAPLR